jgi:PAS domain S-box-containing protein
MKTDRTSLALTAPKLASCTAVLAVVAGAMVIIGWAFDVAVLKSILPDWVAMKANTAVSFILTGIALLLIARPPATFSPQLATFSFRLARFFGLLVGLIGLLTLCEYIFSWNPGIDQWLVSEPAGAVSTSYPGRMAPETALCFVLLAAALWITGGSRKTRWTTLASVSFGLLVTILALAAMLSYATPGLGPYGWFGLTIMAKHTAILFAMLGVAVFAISWQQDVLQWSLSRNTTAAFACGMAVLVLIGFNTNRSQFWLAETDRKIAFSEEVLGDIENILIEVIDAQAHIRGYIITGDEHFKIHYLAAKANSNVKLDALRTLVADNPHQQQQFALIEVQVKAELQWFQQAIDTERAATTDAIRNNMIRHGEDLLDSLRITFNQIASEHHQLIQQLKQESESISRLSYLIISTGMLVSVLIFLTAIFRLNFSMHERKQKGEALTRREAELQESQRITRIGSWEWTLATSVIAWSDGMNHVLARDHSLPAPTFETLQQFYTAESWQQLDTAIAKTLETGVSYDLELEMIRADGAICWTTTRGEAIRGADGSVVKLRGTVHDITEQKLAAESLRESKEKFSMIFESNPAMVAIGTLDGKIVDVNLSYADFFGYSRKEMIGKSLADLGIISVDEFQRLLELGQRAGTSIRNVEVSLRARGGNILNALLSADIVLLNGVPHRLATLLDITERKQAEVKQAEQLEELRRWHEVTLDREERILDLKHEVNDLLGKTGKHPRYPSAESQDPIEV